MPPADHDALRDAVATVRRLAAAESNGELLGELRVSPTWQAATEPIARHFLALLDAGELVLVRGLEWKQKREITWWAPSVLGAFSIYRADDERFRFVDGMTDHETLESAKLAAESYYRSRLAAALEPLLPKVRT